MEEQQWISVKDQLPERCTHVLAATYLSIVDGDRMTPDVVELCFDRIEGEPDWTRDGNFWPNEVTHWQPMPKHHEK